MHSLLRIHEWDLRHPLGGAVNEGCPSLFPFCFLCQGDLEGLGQLVGTGGGLVAAADSLGSSGWHPRPASLHQAGHPPGCCRGSRRRSPPFGPRRPSIFTFICWGADPLGFVLNGQGFPPLLGQYKFSLSYQRFQKNARDHSPWKPCVSLPRLFCKKRAIVSLRVVSQRAHPVDQPLCESPARLALVHKGGDCLQDTKTCPGAGGAAASSGRCSCWPLR